MNDFLNQWGEAMGKWDEMAPKSELLETVLKYLAFICYGWLSIGLLLKFIL